MYIEDLRRFHPDHPPSPYNHPIEINKEGVWGRGVLPDDLELCAVGWLGDDIQSRGETSPRCIELLWKAYESKLTFSDGTAGWHDCEICQGEDEWYPGGKVGPVLNWNSQQLRVYGHGHFLIQYQDTVYLAPVLILHYILDHGYKPPDVFIDAVEKGRFMTTTDLKWMIKE